MRLLLVDGHYYLYRSFHAVRGLKSPDGRPTNAIYGFLRAWGRMVADLKPDRAAVVWDGGLPERRTSLQPAYKQNRAEMPDDLRPQEVWLSDNIPLFGPGSLRVGGVEADDLIASYVMAARKDGADVVIATSDKDIFQVVGPGVGVYSPARGGGAAGFEILGAGHVTGKWGVAPQQLADVLALTGDASDNIPGVPGIGPKTASSIVSRFGPLAGILARPDLVTDSGLRDKIAAHRDLLEANLEMVRLDTNLALPCPWQDLTLAPPSPESLAALESLGLRSLAASMAPRSPDPIPRPAQGELFAD